MGRNSCRGACEDHGDRGGTFVLVLWRWVNYITFTECFNVGIIWRGLGDCFREGVLFTTFFSSVFLWYRLNLTALTVMPSVILGLKKQNCKSVISFMKICF